MKILIVGEEISNYLEALDKASINYVSRNLNDKLIEDISSFDGLLLPGGGDINPELYYQQNQKSEGISNLLDMVQMYYLELFVTNKKKVLGICRGLQLINVYFGGTLIQDIDDDLKVIHTKTEEFDKNHEIEVNKDSFLYKLYGPKMMVNSSHHQAIDDLGKDLIIEARKDNIIEAIRHTSLPIKALQFHPERMNKKYHNEKCDDGSLIFDYFKDHEFNCIIKLKK